MKSLLINDTDNSPKVDFNTTNNILELSGFSRPENPGKFYDYLIQWVENYGKYLITKTANRVSYDKIILKVRLEYYNSSSAKYLLHLFDKFEEIVDSNNIPVEVNWYYDEIDTNMKESGEEYAKMLEKLNFHFIPNPET